MNHHRYNHDDDLVFVFIVTVVETIIYYYYYEQRKLKSNFNDEMHLLCTFRFDSVYKQTDKTGIFL